MREKIEAVSIYFPRRRRILSLLIFRPRWLRAFLRRRIGDKVRPWYLQMLLIVGHEVSYNPSIETDEMPTYPATAYRYVIASSHRRMK